MNYPPDNPNGSHSQSQYTQWSQARESPHNPQWPQQHAQPPTQYASLPASVPPQPAPYTTPHQNPYALPNPYAAPLQAPPPPRSHRQIWRRSFIVLGSLCGIAITTFGMIGLFVTLQSTTSLSTSDASTLSSFIIAGIFIFLGTFIFGKSATSTIGRYTAGFSVVLSAIPFLYGIFLPSHTEAQNNFMGGGVMLLLGGLAFWTTRTRKW